MIFCDNGKTSFSFLNNTSLPRYQSFFISYQAYHQRQHVDGSRYLKIAENVTHRRLFGSIIQTNYIPLWQDKKLLFHDNGVIIVITSWSRPERNENLLQSPWLSMAFILMRAPYRPLKIRLTGNKQQIYTFSNCCERRCTWIILQSESRTLNCWHTKKFCTGRGPPAFSWSWCNKCSILFWIGSEPRDEPLWFASPSQWRTGRQDD